MELVISIVVAILVAVLISETYAWLPKISKLILDRAVRRLDPKDQERYSTEWNANLEDLPNTLMKLVHAISHYVSADRIRTEIVDAEWNSRYEAWKIISQCQKIIMEAVQITEVKSFSSNVLGVEASDSFYENLKRMDELITSISNKYFKPEFNYLTVEEKARHLKEYYADVDQVKIQLEIIADRLKPPLKIITDMESYQPPGL